MRVALNIFALALCACGSAGELEGTVAGEKLSVSSGLFVVLRDASQNPVDTLAVLSSRSDVCADVKANRALPGTTQVVFTLDHRDPTTGVPVGLDLGDYTAGPASDRELSAQFEKLDSSCANALDASATAVTQGTFTVRSVFADPGGSLSASFDLTFGGQDHVTGNLDVSYCDATYSIDPSCG